MGDASGALPLHHQAMADFTRFKVWHEAVALGVAVERIAGTLIVRRVPGAASQLRRAVASISACIAEGSSKPTGREFARFLQMAIGSCGEVEHHLRYVMALRAGSSVECEQLLTRAAVLRRRIVALRVRVLSRSVQRETAEEGPEAKEAQQAKEEPQAKEEQ